MNEFWFIQIKFYFIVNLYFKKSDNITKGKCIAVFSITNNEGSWKKNV